MTRDPLRGARTHWLIAAALIAMHALLAWTQRVTNITTGNDDSVYLLLARSLLGGQYRDLFLIGTPVHTQYPPGYPALLALLGAPADGDVSLVIAVNILLSCFGLALAFDLLRRNAALPRGSAKDSASGGATDDGPTTLLALFTLAALAFNPGLVSAASHVQSEPLFMALTMLAVWVICTRGMDAPSVRWIGVAIAATLGGALVRSVGVAVIGGIFLYWLLRRRWRSAGALALAGVLIVGPWLVWIVVAPRKSAGRSYIADAMLVAPGVTIDSPAAGGAGGSGGGGDRGKAADAALFVNTLAARVATNAPLYLTRRLPTQLRLPTAAGTVLDNALWLVVILAAAGSGIIMFWRSYRVIVLILLCYCTLLLLWPYALGRFLTPVLPFILALLTFGLWGIGSWLARRAGGVSRPWIAVLLPGAFAVVLAGAGASSILGRGSTNEDCDAPNLCGGRVSDSRYIDFVEKLEPHLPTDARIFTAKEGAFYYLTGKRSIPIYEALGLDSVQLGQFLRERRLTTIVLTHLVVEEEQLAMPLRGICTELGVIAADPPELLALSTVPDSLRQTDACAALAVWNSAW